MARKLAATVYLTNDEGTVVQLLGDSVPPRWAVPRIGEHCYAPVVAGDEVGPQVDVQPLPAKAATKGEWAIYGTSIGATFDPKANKEEMIAQITGESGGGSDPAPERPAGDASLEVWRAYAQSVDVSVEGLDDVASIVAAVDTRV